VKQKDMMIKRRTATVITVLYILLCSLLYIWGDFKDVQAIFFLACFAAKIVLYMAVFIVWLVYADAYIAMRVGTKKKIESKTSYRWDIVGVGFVFILGFVALYYLLDLIYYLASEWKIVDGLLVCILCNVGVLAGWFLLWMCSVKLTGCISNAQKIIKKGLILALLIVFSVAFAYLTHIGKEYVKKETESVWTKKMIEYYDENGMGPDVPPFSRR